MSTMPNSISDDDIRPNPAIVAYRVAFEEIDAFLRGWARARNNPKLKRTDRCYSTYTQALKDARKEIEMLYIFADCYKNPAAVALGRKGGKAKSDAKTAAVRENGKKGGRPKKSA